MAKFTHLSKQAILERPEFRAFQIIPAFVLSCGDFVSPWITLPTTHHCADSLIGRIYRNGGSACVVHIVLNLGTLGRVHVIQCKVKTTWNNLGQNSRNSLQSEKNLGPISTNSIQSAGALWEQSGAGFNKISAKWDNLGQVSRNLVVQITL